MAGSKPEIDLTNSERVALYAARRFIPGGLEEKLGIRIPIDVYFQDPLVAAENPKLAFDHCLVQWEPGFADGPTTARFAVVDYDGHTESLAPPARWDPKLRGFVAPDGSLLDQSQATLPQYHQVHAWALVQRALEFFESGWGLGRRIPWGFEGNRLILVPHAGPGENAFYDRQSKSLQFYYFDSPDGRVFTCLSTDIVHHEFGHAMLDGIRPLFIEAVLPETAAFHEFVGDLTAILIALRNTPFRQRLIDETKGDLSRESTLSKVAEQFGKEVDDKPYLRSAKNGLKMKDVANNQRPHFMSQVLTGAMFDILIQLSKHYVSKRGRTVPQAFWDTIQRMQNMGVQPLDFLPPVDVTFSDYARAVLRAEEVANPTGPDNYRGMMLDTFINRGILDASAGAELRRPRRVFERLDLDVFHDMDSVCSSRADAYRFLDDNRNKLFIPHNADIVVTDLSIAHKLTREARQQPKQVLLQYTWREDVVLEGPQFERFDGTVTSLLCGGTLALNENGDLLAWPRKPGSQPAGKGPAAVEEQAKGNARLAAFLEALARRIRAGRIGPAIESSKGLLGRSTRPLAARTVDGILRFELTPHFGIHDDEDDDEGSRAWHISS